MKRVVAGHKANLANHRTSDESKEASRAFIAKFEGGGEQSEHDAEIHHNRVVGGHKAAIGQYAHSVDRP